MHFGPTIVEGATPGDRPTGRTEDRAAETIREPRPEAEAGRAPPTVIERPQTAGPTPTLNLVSGADFLHYRLVRPLKAAGAEADLWLMERRADAATFILKLYRYGFEPKAQIKEKVRHLRQEHVVELFEEGQVADHYYEVLEYIRHGTLEELMRQGRLPQPRVREVLSELASAVEHLQAADIIHRDIKPSNIMVRRLEPLDLVLADFGISSVAKLSVIVTSVNRTPAYSAPEALTGTISKASDWWSVGVIMLELITGRHPFEGLTEAAINSELVNRGIEVPERGLPGDWPMLLMGLLTRDSSRRWRGEQVQGWLAGRRDQPVFYLRQRPAESHKPLKFADQDYYQPADLALALGEHWEEGVKRLARGGIAVWVKEELKNDDLFSRLEELGQEKGLDAELRLALAIMVLHPQAPLSWRGEVVTAEWLPGNLEAARRMLESALPHWLKVLRKESWLEVLQERWRRHWTFLNESGVPLDQTLSARMILCPPQQVKTEAREQRARCWRADHPVLTFLLQKGEWEEPEAVLLLACDQTLLWTKRQEWLQECATQITRLNELANEVQAVPTSKKLLQTKDQELVAVDRRLAARLAELASPQPLQDEPDYQAARNLLQELRRRIQTLLTDHAKQSQIISLAETGHYEVAQELFGRLERVFDDIDYPAMEAAIGAGARNFLLGKVRAGQIATAAARFTAMQSWYGPQYSDLQQAVFQAASAYFQAAVEAGEIGLVRAKLAEARRLEGFAVGPWEQAVHRAVEADLIARVQTGQVATVRRQLEAAQQGDGFDYPSAQNALQQATSFYARPGIELDQWRQDFRTGAKRSHAYRLFIQPFKNLWLGSRLNALAGLLAEGRQRLAQSPGTELAEEATDAIRQMDQQLAEMARSLAIRRAADWYWLLALAGVVVLLILLGLMLYLLHSSASL